MPDAKPEVPTIDVEVISETKDSDKVSSISPSFETAAKIFDHTLEAVDKAVEAVAEIGIDTKAGSPVGDAAAVARETLGVAAEGLREAGVKAHEAEVAVGKAYTQIEKLGKTLTEIRGGRGAFNRRVNW
jgi:hypothetical protein